MATRKKSKNGGYDFNFEKIPRLLRNRYFVIAILFGIWVAFFDKHNIIQQFKLQRTVLDLEEKRSYYEREIGQVKRNQRELFSSDESLEQFAREKYYMKRRNEDVFVIIEE